MNTAQAGKLALYILIALFTAAWGDDNDCGIADNVTLLKKFKSKNGNYFVYRRISGFHDKIEFYQLYIKKPTFDNCGATKQKVIYTTSAESTKGYVKTVILKQNRIRLLYSRKRVDIPEVKLAR